MSALELLLGPSPAGEDGTCARPRTLLFPDGLQVHMQESATAEDVVLFSLLGSLGDAGHFPEDRPWKFALPHPHCANARCIVTVESGSGRMYLIDVWPRAELHPQSIAEMLEDHALRHRVWRRILNEMESESPESCGQDAGEPGSVGFDEDGS